MTCVANAMVVQKRRDVTQEAQDYLSQFKGARSRPSSSKHRRADDSFEAMLDTWTREKFQSKITKKTTSTARGVNHRHRHHSDREWDNPVPALLDHFTVDTSKGLWTEGQLFAEAELDDDGQETYMNEEALLEQLLQQEPPRSSRNSNSKKSNKRTAGSRNKNTCEQPSHSTPKASMESFEHEAMAHDDFALTNVDSVHAIRPSRRASPPPLPPHASQWHEGDESGMPSHYADMPACHGDMPSCHGDMPSCHNCGWTYTAEDSQVLDLPELLNILTPKSPRKLSKAHEDLMLTTDGQTPPPLPSKPRPPPPAYHKARSHDNVSPRNHGNNSRSVNNVLPIGLSHKHFYDSETAYGRHEHSYSLQNTLHADNSEAILERHSPRAAGNTYKYSPRYHRARSPGATSPNTSPRIRARQASTRGTQTDPNLLSQDLSPVALVDKDKSSDTDNGRASRDKIFTRAKPPSGPSLKERRESFDGSQHLQATEPILEAAKAGKLGVMKQMVESDYEQMKMRDIQGNSLMHVCCERGHLSCVQYLYQHCAYLCEDENKAKFTPAVLTIKGGQSEVLDWLLENTEAKDEILPLPNKKSLLHHAAKFGQDGCLRIVLEKLSGMGRLTSCCDGNGNSPAHVAAKHGHLSCLQILVEYGMDVTKANKYGHSPCYYADFSNHRQCAGFLMVVETCLNLAKKLIRLEKSMEQLSSSLAKCSGDYSQSDSIGDVHLPYDYCAGADKSSATSSVEDDGTRDEAWQLLCRKFEEASKRLVVFRTQNRAIRPLKPTKLAMLALAQTREETQAAFSLLVGNTHLTSCKSLNNNLHPSNTRLVENRSRSFPDLLSAQSAEERIPSTEESLGNQRLASLRRCEFNDTVPKHHHSQPDLTTSDDSSYPMGTDFHQFYLSKSQKSQPQCDSSLTYHDESGKPVPPPRQRTTSHSTALNSKTMSSSIYRYDNDLEYHLKTRVLPPKSTFRPEKYLIENWQQIDNQEQHALLEQPLTSQLDPYPRLRHTRDAPPPPPVDNETSDFFEDSNGRHDSETSELDQETLRKIFDMQNEILRCQGAELGRARVQTPVKLKLSDQDFKEAYERSEGREDQADSTEDEPPVLQRYRRVIRSRQPPEPPVIQPSMPHPLDANVRQAVNSSLPHSSDPTVRQTTKLHVRPPLEPSVRHRQPQPPNRFVLPDAPTRQPANKTANQIQTNLPVRQAPKSPKRQPPELPVRQVQPESPMRSADIAEESVDTRNKSCNNSHTNSLIDPLHSDIGFNDSLQSGLRLDDSLQSGLRHDDSLDETLEDAQSNHETAPFNSTEHGDCFKPWYEMSDDDESKSRQEPEEYFTLL